MKINMATIFKNKIIFILPVILLLQSCHYVEVTSEYDKRADFGSFKTFTAPQLTEDTTGTINDFDRQRIINAISFELEARGYTKTSLNADMKVEAHIVTRDKWYTEVVTDRDRGTSRTRIDTYEYIEGTLVIHVKNAKTQKLLWEGIGIGTVDKSAKNKEKRVGNAVAKIFKRYPIAKDQ